MMKRLPLLGLLAIASCGGDPVAPALVPTSASSAAVAPSAAPSADPPPPKGVRLSRTASPVRYAATLTIIPGQPTIEGAIDLDLTFAEPSSILWLNAVDLTVTEASLVVAGASRPARVVPGGDDLLGFAFDRAPAGPARLHVVYRSKVSDKDDRGVFTEQEDGVPYVYSQFENIDARRAFPCFDEPTFKVPWQLTLRVPKDATALSNTPSIGETPADGGLKVVRFAETKPLPSYLVAFAVGPFELVDAGKHGQKGTPVRIAVPPGKKAEVAYAASVTGPLLARLETFFGLPYPYEKLDIVPIPHLVSFGAMENAGLITFFRAGALARPEEDTITFKRRYASIITHEMAHQWFGDLVTMPFWDDIWLNEAFATWMEPEILGPFKPEWTLEATSQREIAMAMRSDALVSVRKIRQEILTKDDIQNAFDGITYEKGASVISMFESWVGPERFQKGVHRYLEKHAFGSATSADFVAAISAEAGRDVGPAFSSFLDQPGVPLVSAELSCDAKSGAHVALSQERYFPAGSRGAAPTTWQIPVCVRYGAGKETGRACTLLADKTATLALPPLPGKHCPEWLLPNERGAGYYHAALSPKATGVLFGALESLSLTERLALTTDLGALMAAGKLPAGEALAHLSALVRDPSTDVQRAATEIVRGLPDRVIDPALRPAFAKFVERTFGKRAKEIGLRPRAGESDAVRVLRPMMLGLVMDRGEDRALLAEADHLARAWLDDPKAVEDDVVDLVLDNTARHGDRALFDRFLAELKKSTDDTRRQHLLRALASFRDPALVRASLGLYLGSELDPREAVELLFQDDRSAATTFAFVKESFDRLLPRVPGPIRGDLPRFAENLCSEAERADAEAFFKPRVAELTGGPRELAQSLESVALCSAFRDVQKDSLASFLKKP